MRIGIVARSVSSLSLWFGKIGVRSSKCFLLAAASGRYPFTDSTNSRAPNFSLWLFTRMAPFKISPDFKLNLRIWVGDT